MFNLDLIQDEADRTPWEFAYAGRKWKLPHVADLTLNEQAAIEHADVKSVIAQRAIEITDDGDVENGAELARLWGTRKGSTTGKFLVAWLAHAGMEPGESPASSR